jgi:hypothetical protein
MPAPTPSPAPPSTPTPTPVSGFGAGRDAFVTTLYAEILGRPPEQSALLFWSGTLASGVKPQVVAQAIFASAEHQSLLKLHLVPTISFQRAFDHALQVEQQAARSHI